MPANSVAKRLTYKAYAAGAISGTPPALATDPQSTGGQILRYVTATPNLNRSSFESQEKDTTRQMFNRRSGGHSVPMGINFELSPLTYQDLFAPILRNIWPAAVSTTNTEFTSM